MTKSILLRAKIKAPPEEIYRALTNPFTIELWTGEPAVMSEEPGSEFMMLDGYITGRNVAFKPNESIEQIWYFGEDHHSKVTIRIFPDKANAQLRIEHTNIPEEAYDDMLEGWQDVYLASLKIFFEK